MNWGYCIGAVVLAAIFYVLGMLIGSYYGQREENRRLWRSEKNFCMTMECFDTERYGTTDPDALKHFDKELELKKILFLILQMRIRMADKEETERAYRHAMVILDAERLHLDWERSESENGIKELRNKYVGWNLYKRANNIIKMEGEHENE